MADFVQGIIPIRYYTDVWGEYIFNFPACTSATANDGALPYNSTIASCNVRAFLGNVKATSTLASETEISDNIIEPAYTPQIVANAIHVKFQYPGDDYKGQKATLIFELTLNTGAKYPFYFQYLKVE